MSFTRAKSRLAPLFLSLAMGLGNASAFASPGVQPSSAPHPTGAPTAPANQNNQTAQETGSLPSPAMFEYAALGTVRIEGPIVPQTAASIITRLKMLDATASENAVITVLIDSPGGSVIDGLAIYDTMMNMKHPVATVCEGMCASMAAYLLATGTPGMRSALPHAKIMVHDARMMGGGDSVITLRDLKKTEKGLNETTGTLTQILSEHTGIKEADLKAFAEAQDQFLTPEEAVQLNIIDKVEQPYRKPPFPMPSNPLPDKFKKRLG